MSLLKWTGLTTYTALYAKDKNKTKQNLKNFTEKEFQFITASLAFCLRVEEASKFRSSSSVLKEK